MKDKDYLMFIEILLKLIPRHEKERLYYMLMGCAINSKKEN